MATTTDTPPVRNWDLNVNSITIRWTAPATNGGADVTSYEVWVGTATVTDAAAIAALTPTVTNLPAMRLEYISVGLTASTEYFYRVRARNGSGPNRVSLWSTEQPGTTTATQAGTPGAPTSLTGTATGTTGNVALTWTGPTGDPGEGDSPITHYEVQYQRDDPPDDDDDWSDATTVTSEVTSWTHMGAPGASTMEYRVRAVNASGAGAWSDQDPNTDGIQPLQVVVGPRIASAPMLTATSAGTDEILLEWNTPEHNGTPITGYTIQRAAADATDWTSPTEVSATVPMTDVVYSDTGLMAGTKYYYRIQANPGGAFSATTIAASATATTEKGCSDNADAVGWRRRHPDGG